MKDLVVLILREAPSRRQSFVEPRRCRATKRYEEYRVGKVVGGIGELKGRTQFHLMGSILEQVVSCIGD